MRLIKFLLIGILFTSPVYADEIDDIVPFVIQVESGGNPNAVSGKGAVGLMQITSIVIAEFKEQCFTYGVERVTFGGDFYIERGAVNPFNPKVNKIIGEWYLRRLRDLYLNNEVADEECNLLHIPKGTPLTDIDDICLPFILAAYNGGITKLRKVNYDINKMPRETREYVKKVMRLYNASR